MFSATETIVIARPIDDVFAYLADARNRPDWDDTVISETLTSPEPIALGTTVHTELRSMGRTYGYDWVVTRFDEPRAMTIESTAGPLPTTLHYEFERAGAATTRVRFAVTGRPRGVLRLIQPLLARNTRRDLRRNFARLESGAPLRN